MRPKIPSRLSRPPCGAPIDWWLRFGRARLHGVDYFEGVYFGSYPSQGGFNQRHDLTLLVPLNRIRPYVGGYYLSTNDRPGYEIDVRLRRNETEVNGGVIVRLASKLDLDVSGRQTTYEYDDEEYAGTPYSTRLNRRTENFGAQARYRLTPLTTLTLLGDSVRERFSEYPDSRQRRVPHPAGRRVRPARPDPGQGPGWLPELRHRSNRHARLLGAGRQR